MHARCMRIAGANSLPLATLKPASQLRHGGQVRGEGGKQHADGHTQAYHVSTANAAW